MVNAIAHGKSKTAAQELPQPRILQIARAIEQDIRRRKLAPGDPYLSTQETAQMLGVSINVANRALKLLTQRRLLDRKQRTGAVIAQPLEPEQSGAFRRVHVVVNERYVKYEGLYSDGLTLGLQGVLPDAEVQFNYLPNHNAEDHIRRLIESAQDDPGPIGFVVSKASISVQRMIMESGLPALVHGSAYWSHGMLSSFDRNNKQVGGMAMQHLIDQGARNILVLNRDQFYPGDHDMLDAVVEAAGANDICVTGVILRALPPDDSIVISEVQKLLEQCHEPVGIIAQAERHAVHAASAVELMGMKPGIDIPIVVLTLFRQGKENPPRFPYIHSLTPAEEQGKLMGQMLLRMHRDIDYQPEHVRIPVELIDVG